jgi:3-oxoacyl-[acyl-carrier-protein] synthase-1
MVEKLQNGIGGLAPCHFETVSLPAYVGEVAGVDDVRIKDELQAYDCRNNRLVQLALEQDDFADAVQAARTKYGAARIGVFLGTSTSGLLHSELAYRNRDPQSGALPSDFYFTTTHNTASLAAFVQQYFRLDGPALTVSAACASTAKVFANAARMIEVGLCDAAIVGGADSLCLTTLYGFNSLELVSSDPCRPFDVNRNGISIGEAAGFALLEKATGSHGRDATMVLGVGESSDAYHMSTPHPEGLGARLAMERALDAAGLPASAIDYVNMHGTATRVGDASEDKALVAVFGTQTACSSTKGYLGHTLGASGITEAIICAQAIQNDFLPGSYNTRELDPAICCRYLLNSQPDRVDTVMTNSFGFGGSNCSLILGRAQ